MTTTRKTSAPALRITALHARIALTAAVALGTFYISASHIVRVASAAGNHGLAAYVYPVAIDCVILASVITLVARKGVNWKAKGYAAAGRIFGFGATIYCNLAASGWTSLTSAIVNLIPALSLIIVMELLVHTAQGTPATRASQPAAKRTTKAPAKRTATKTNVTPIRSRKSG
jgi:hypothetical protein